MTLIPLALAFKFSCCSECFALLHCASWLAVTTCLTSCWVLKPVLLTHLNPDIGRFKLIRHLPCLIRVLAPLNTCLPKPFACIWLFAWKRLVCARLNESSLQPGQICVARSFHHDRWPSLRFHRWATPPPRDHCQGHELASVRTAPPGPTTAALGNVSTVARHHGRPPMVRCLRDGCCINTGRRQLREIIDICPLPPARASARYKVLHHRRRCNCSSTGCVSIRSCLKRSKEPRDM